MRIRDEIRLSVGALLLVQILTMVAAVTLLARMTPAIEQILEDNEKSIRAVERMLLALAEAPPAPDAAADRTARFEQSLAVAKGNITETEEGPALDVIEAQHLAALAGDQVALELVRERLRELGDVNREIMRAANERAKRLGTAGTWALVFLGLIGLLFSMALIRRAQVKLIAPVYELSAVLEACHEGDPHRRFAPAQASSEFHEVAEIVNQLVGEHFDSAARDWEHVAQIDRVALLALLDAEPCPALVCDPSGSIVAMNERARAQVEARSTALRAGLEQLAAGHASDGAAPTGIRAQPLAGGGWLCRLELSPTAG